MDTRTQKKVNIRRNVINRGMKRKKLITSKEERGTAEKDI